MSKKKKEWKEWWEWRFNLEAYANISFLEAKKDFEDGGSAEFLLPEKIVKDLQFFWCFPFMRRGKAIAEAKGVVLSYKERESYIEFKEERREENLKSLKATDYRNKLYWRDFFKEGHYKRFVDCLIKNFPKILEKAEVQNLINTIWQGDSSKLQEVHRSAVDFFSKDLQQIRDGMFEVEDREAKNQARVTTPQRRTAELSSVKPPAKIDDWVGCTRELGGSFAKWFKSTGEILKKGLWRLLSISKKLLWWSGGVIKKFWGKILGVGITIVIGVAIYLIGNYLWAGHIKKCLDENSWNLTVCMGEWFSWWPW